jgi:peptidoglycan L-alanyl-D-glutamate endopeptidase CwlK
MNHDARTAGNLRGVHPVLAGLIVEQLKRTPGLFVVTEGVRTLDRQKQLFAAGATTTLNSRHLTGHAVDLAALVNGEIRWDWPLYKKIADEIKRTASDMGVAIEWGGDFKTFKDGPHFQLNRRFYP